MTVTFLFFCFPFNKKNKKEKVTAVENVDFSSKSMIIKDDFLPQGRKY